MLEQSKIDLAKYRLDKAKECLRVAGYLIEPEEYLSILNKPNFCNQSHTRVSLTCG